ncbi:hypothetical protein TWF718_009275 [Orbilia javanica]|uniref:Uncharacterized protein n=1 Tax=Orbilia javanica TaxID=47235 RepID=A0AAN8MVS8_9PEZI
MSFSTFGSPGQQQDLEEEDRIFRELAESYAPIQYHELGDFPNLPLPPLPLGPHPNDRATYLNGSVPGQNFNRFGGSIGYESHFTGPREPEEVIITRVVPLPPQPPSPTIQSAPSPKAHPQPSSPAQPSSPTQPSSSICSSPSIQSNSSPTPQRSPLVNVEQKEKVYPRGPPWVRGKTWDPVEIPPGSYDSPEIMAQPPSKAAAAAAPARRNYGLRSGTRQKPAEKEGPFNDSDWEEEMGTGRKGRVQAGTPPRSKPLRGSGGPTAYTMEEKNFLIWAVGCPPDSPTLKFTATRAGVECPDWAQISQALGRWMAEKHPEIDVPFRKPETLREQWSRPEKVAPGQPKRTVRVKESWEALTNPSVLNSRAQPWEDTQDLQDDRGRMDEWFNQGG